jgi:dCMP deaminase
MKSYLVKARTTGSYKGRRSWVNDLNQARLFQRVCDAKNSCRMNPSKFSKWEDQYELIACDIVPEPRRFKIVATCPSIPPGFKPSVHKTREEAQAWINLLTKHHNIHNDYFKIEETPEQTTINCLPNNRPSWTDYFLGLAVIISKRSHDIHTQHGTILVDSKTKHILATGYNGYPRGMNDNSLPTARPDKYAWMLHSEFNACCNLTRPANNDTIAYVTGEPCTNCLMCLWQHGIGYVIHRDAYGSKHLIDENTRKQRDILLSQTGMVVEVVKTNLDWLKAACLSV